MIWAGVIVALLLFVSMFDSRTASSAGAGIAYSEFRAKVQEGQVKDVAIAADRISGTLTSGQKFSTVPVNDPGLTGLRSEEHTSELQSLMRISYAVFCLKNKKHHNTTQTTTYIKHSQYTR